MRVHYFVIDNAKQIRRTTCEAVEQLWNHECMVDELGCQVDDELRLISVLCDDRIQPVVSYFVRLQVADGEITRESRIDAFEAMTAQKRRKYDNPAARRQLAGWPRDWQRQLAVALDVPAGAFKKLGIGGPLLMSELWGVPLEKVLQYFEEAYHGRETQ